MTTKTKKPFLKQLVFLSSLVFFLWLNFLSAQEFVSLEIYNQGCQGSRAFVQLQWTSTISKNPTYIILRKTAEGDFLEISSTTESSYSDNSIESDKVYTYKIKAKKGSEVIESNEVLSSAQHCPAVISSFNSSCSAQGPHIILNWTAASGNLLNYEIYRDNFLIGTTTENNFDDNINLEGTKEYNYYLKTIWQGGNSSNSPIVKIQAQACSPNLTLNSTCLTSNPGGQAINLSWNNLLGVREYQIYRQLPGESNFSLLKNGLTQTSFSDNLVESFSNYYQSGKILYKVKAIWQDGTEKDSQTQSIDTATCPPFLTVENNCDEFSFRLSWTKSLGASHYNIYRNNEFLFQTSNNSYIDYLNLSLCLNYKCNFTYSVKAIGSGFPSEGLSSNLVEKSIDCATITPPSPPPTLLEPSNYCVNGFPYIRISWTPSNNVAYYGLYRSSSAGVYNINLTQTFYEDKVESNVNYIYYLIAFGKGGAFVFSTNSQEVVSISCVQPSIPILNLNADCSNGLPYIDLNWTETSNTYGYEIYRGKDLNNLTLLKSITKNDPEFFSRTWRDNQIVTSTTYYYKIIATGPPGVLPSSSEIKSISSLSCLPTTPVLTLSRGCENTLPIVNLSWTTDGKNTTRYEIFRREWSPTIPIYVINDVNIKNWKDNNNLSPETLYRYKIDAVGPSGRSSSDVRSTTTYYCLPPDNFNLNEPNIFCQGSYPQATLSWGNSFHSSSYSLYRDKLVNNNVSETTEIPNVNSPFVEKGFGNALSFDGNDFVDFGNPNIPLTGNLTIEFWAKPTNVSYARQNPICKYYINEFCLTMETNGSLSYYHGNNSSYISFNAPNIFSNNVLVHFVLTRDLATRTLRAYKNGNFVNFATWSSNYDPVATNNYTLKIGRGYLSNDFRGVIDEVRIYNRVLSESEINEHYQGIYNNEANLIGLWHFDEGSGQVVSDSSNYGNNGSLGSTNISDVNDPTWIINGIQSNNNYQWRVKAFTPGGSTNSTPESTASYSIPFCLPTKPGLILNHFCEPINNQPNIRLNWSFSYGAVRYEIYRQDKGLIKTIDQGSNDFISRSWVDNSDIKPGEHYQYYIKAIGAGDLINQSDSISISAPICFPPSEPEDLIVSFNCDGSYPRVDLSWATSSNAKYYTLYRIPSASPFPVYTDSNFYRDTNVEVNKVYQYYVVAYNPGGSSSSSEIVSIKTNYCHPSVPTITGLNTDCENKHCVNYLSWSDQTIFNTFEYRIYRNTSNSLPANPIKTIASTSPEFISRSWKDDTGLNYPNTYYYWIKAVGPAGESNYSSVRAISVYSCGIAPADPHLTLDNIFCQDNTPFATLGWNSVSNAYSYALYRINPDSISVYNTQISPLTDRGSFSLRFDGTDDYVKFSQPLTLTDFSIELWANIGTKTSDWRTLIGDVGSGWKFNLNSGDYYLNAYSQGQLKSTFQLTPGQWYYIVLTQDSSGTKLYINGVLNNQNSNTNTINNITFQLGRWYTSQYYQGLIDDVRIYGRALSADEIWDHYNSIYKNERELKAVWHLDEGSGLTAYDKSGNGNNGTLYNGVSWRTDAPDSLEILPLENLKNYRYKLKAFGIDTESDFSNEINFATSCLPLKPNLFLEPQCTINGSQIKLSWNFDSNTVSWTIHKKRTGEDWDKFPFPITIATTSYIDKEVESGVSYEYYITATGKEFSTTSDLVSQTAPLCFGEPEKPVISTTSPQCASYSPRIVVEWEKDLTGNTISYNVYRRDINEENFVEIYSGLSSQSTSYNDIGVTANHTYIYRIEAVGINSSKLSEDSSQTIAYDCANTPPFPAPELKVNSVWSVANKVAVSLGWTDIQNEQEYQIFRTGSDFHLIATTAYDISNYVDYSVEDGKTYTYKILAKNNNGSVESNPVEVEIPIARPGEFSLSGKLDEGVIKFSWTKALTTQAGGVVTYILERGDENNNFSNTSCTISCPDINCNIDLQCVINNFSFLQPYYRVKASNNADSSTYSNTVRIHPPLPRWIEISE